jgi:hypothetical protein
MPRPVTQGQADAAVIRLDFLKGLRGAPAGYGRAIARRAVMPRRARRQRASRGR